MPPAFSNAHGLEPPPILVTASFGHIIPSKFLINHFPQPHTRLNVHPSLLPEFRGAAPIQWSIIKAADNKVETGVTVQSLEYGKGKVDCGAIWAQDASVASVFFARLAQKQMDTPHFLTWVLSTFP